MRYLATEKLEVIRLVEQSHLPAKRTLEILGISKTTFYRWYDRYRAFGEVGLEDRRPHPGRVWNRIPDDVRGAVVNLALDEPDLSPRELAVRFSDTKKYFVSEASVYRILKAEDLITSPAFIVLKAADEFRDKTTRPDQLWQTDFTYLKGEPLRRHVFETNGERLGLVLSQHHPRRLQPIRDRLEALHDHARQGRHRHA
jgi:putative transposase